MVEFVLRSVNTCIPGHHRLSVNQLPSARRIPRHSDRQVDLFYDLFSAPMFHHSVCSVTTAHTVHELDTEFFHIATTWRDNQCFFLKVQYP